ncbi:MAG: hypothetical protein LBS67_01095 [Clostridiales Family XIII bacterium]|jgi:hypothetical protein|nr:hypothetical protein [Clostridiales Family XIII bacterium]
MEFDIVGILEPSAQPGHATRLGGAKFFGSRDDAEPREDAGERGKIAEP